MTDSVDIALQKVNTTDDNYYYDISVGEDGDLAGERGFNTSIIYALWGEERADQSEVPSSERRRGWWGNLFSETIYNIPDFQNGSKLWLLYQERRTQLILNKTEDYAYSALNWLIDEGYADRIETSAHFTSSGMRLVITIYRNNSIIFSKAYDLWENTGE